MLSNKLTGENQTQICVIWQVNVKQCFFLITIILAILFISYTLYVCLSLNNTGFLKSHICLYFLVFHFQGSLSLTRFTQLCVFWQMSIQLEIYLLFMESWNYHSSYVWPQWSYFFALQNCRASFVCLRFSPRHSQSVHCVSIIDTNHRRLRSESLCSHSLHFQMTL